MNGVDCQLTPFMMDTFFKVKKIFNERFAGNLFDLTSPALHSDNQTK